MKKPENEHEYQILCELRDAERSYITQVLASRNRLAAREDIVTVENRKELFAQIDRAMVIEQGRLEDIEKVISEYEREQE